MIRKAQEDNKNEPGAADFYYGEMEMRRAAQSTSLSERFVLWLYWLFVGYGLRAMRPLVTLVVLICVVAIVFWQGGLVPSPPYINSLVYAVQASIAIENRDRQLTLSGEVARTFVRLCGPLLLGLTLLSVRNRVKR